MKQTKHIFRIYDIKQEEWLTQMTWDASYIVWNKNINKAKKWVTAKSLSEFLATVVANEDAKDFNEIPDTWQVRKFEIKTEINELEDDLKPAAVFVSEQIRWPHLHKFWIYPFHEWELKSAIRNLPITFSPQFAIRFDSGYDLYKGQINEKFNVADVRRLLIKAKKRLTGEMRVFLRHKTVFVSNEDDLTIVKMMLSEHITYILNMKTGLDPAGREIEIEDAGY